MRAVFAEEQAHLLALPDNPFPAEERVPVRAHKTPYVRFDLNDYSVPDTHVRRSLIVIATLDTVRVVDGLDVLATHPRSFDRGAQIEDRSHIEALTQRKRAAKAHRGQDRLQHAAPSTKSLFGRAASRGVHLGVLTRGLTALLDSHGAAALEAAIVAALAEDTAHLGAVRHFIDHHRHAIGQAPPIAVALPKDPRVHHTVRPHPLHDYEALSRKKPDDATDA